MRANAAAEPVMSPIQKRVQDRSLELKKSGASLLDEAIALVQEFGSNLDGNTGAHFSSPAEAGEFAKMMNANLQSSIGQYVGAVQAVRPERLELLRQQFGEEFVADYVRRNKENFNAAKSLLEADQAILSKGFDVVGKLVEWDEQGMPSIGQFALSGHGIYAEGPRGAPAKPEAGMGLSFKLTDYQAEVDSSALARARETKGLGVDKSA
jgi:hypothetical protein